MGPLPPTTPAAAGGSGKRAASSSGKRRRSTSRPPKSPGTDGMAYLSSCEVCGMEGLEDKRTLNTHLQEHCDSSCVCPILACKKRFKTTTAVVTHLLTMHHKVVVGSQLELFPEHNYRMPQRTYCECWECQPSHFEDVTELENHILQHIPKRYPAQCILSLGDQTCMFMADSQDLLTEHILRTHYELVTLCSVCGANASDHVCKVRPQQLVGERIAVRWMRGGQYAWYDGLVLEYKPSDSTFLIHYDDGSRIHENLLQRFW